jgi:hypothetical protein
MSIALRNPLNNSPPVPVYSKRSPPSENELETYFLTLTLAQKVYIPKVTTLRRKLIIQIL